MGSVLEQKNLQQYVPSWCKAKKQSKRTSVAQSLQTQVQTSVGVNGIANPPLEVAHRHR